MVKVLTTCRFLEIGQAKMFFSLTAHQNIYLLFPKKISLTHRHKQKSKRNYDKRRHTKEIKEKKEKKNVAVVNSICRKSNDTSELAVKVVSHLRSCL